MIFLCPSDMTNWCPEEALNKFLGASCSANAVNEIPNSQRQVIKIQATTTRGLSFVVIEQFLEHKIIQNITNHGVLRNKKLLLVRHISREYFRLIIELRKQACYKRVGWLDCRHRLMLMTQQPSLAFLLCQCYYTIFFVLESMIESHLYCHIPRVN